MARDIYETVVALPDATGTLKALSGVKVSVIARGAVDVAAGAVAIDVFQKDTGTAKGPDPATGATGTNPMVTGASGAIRFWAEAPFEYDIVFEDTQVPARVTDRAGWNAISAKSGTFPTAFLAPDAGITLKMLGADVMRQYAPIGSVQDWWRPSNVVTPPSTPDGWEIADGHIVNSHDVPGISGSITVPNLQNVFILGASSGKADGAIADLGNAAAQGPGIRGTGGSNAGRDLGHTHAVTLPNHRHDATGLSTGGHTHGVSVSGNTSEPNLSVNNPNATGGVLYPNWHHIHSFTGTGGTSDPGNIGVNGMTGYVTDGAALLGASTLAQLAWTVPPSDFRPQHYGLLRIIKVKRS